MAKLYDTHCHLYSEYNYDLNEIVENFKKDDIGFVINNGTNFKTNEEVLSISKKFSSIKPAIGFHPEDLDNFKEEQLDQIIQNINNIIAIGEIGLDYYYSENSKDLQKKVFEKQIQIAEKYNKPVIIHSRNAFKDTFDIVKKYNVKGSWHCFSGSLEEANKIIGLGFKLGIGGILTFKNSNLNEIISEIDLKNILLETDSPYLSPEPFRGKRNEPKNVKIILENIARIKNIDYINAAQIIENNTLETFRMN